MSGIPIEIVRRHTPRDLRLRQPHPDRCLPHPDCCGECAWNIVAPDSPDYQPGAEVPEDLVELPGSYTGNCGSVQIVQAHPGQIGAVHLGRFYVANPESKAFQDYSSAMGLDPADEA